MANICIQLYTVTPVFPAHPQLVNRRPELSLASKNMKLLLGFLLCCFANGSPGKQKGRRTFARECPDGPSLGIKCDAKRPWPQCPPQSYCFSTNSVDAGAKYYCCPIYGAGAPRKDTRRKSTETSPNTVFPRIDKRDRRRFGRGRGSGNSFSVSRILLSTAILCQLLMIFKIAGQ